MIQLTAEEFVSVRKDWFAARSRSLLILCDIARLLWLVIKMTLKGMQTLKDMGCG